jgi:hypothetical protein
VRATRPAGEGSSTTMESAVPVTHCEYDLYVVDTLGASGDQSLESALFQAESSNLASFESLLCTNQRTGFFAETYGMPSQTGDLRSPLFTFQPSRARWVRVKMTTVVTSGQVTAGIVAITPDQGLEESRVLSYPVPLESPNVTFSLSAFEPAQVEIDMYYDNVRCR